MSWRVTRDGRASPRVLRVYARGARAVELLTLVGFGVILHQWEWPRIVAVIDEFQYLFVERDAVSRTAQALLEDIARRGRSQGIHLVLASQDVSGIEAFWGRPAIFEQFVLRIALPRARRVLETELAAFAARDYGIKRAA